MIADRRRDAEVHRVRDLLEWDHAAGTFGDAYLPSERDLGLRYGASRNAVRVALAELVRAGRLVRLQGRGTKLRLTAITQQSEANVLIGASARSGGSMLDCRVAPMSASYTAFFDHGEFPMALQASWVSTTAEGPLEFAHITVPDYRRTAVSFEEFEGDIFRFLALQGHDVVGADADVYATSADAITARALQVEHGSPVFAVQGVQRDEGGRAVSAGTSVFHAARVRMRITPSAPRL